jgi:hypothetical protein
MTRYRVVVSQWEWEGDCEDEGDALIQADMEFSLIDNARIEEIAPDEEGAE